MFGGDSPSVYFFYFQLNSRKIKSFGGLYTDSAQPVAAGSLKLTKPSNLEVDAPEFSDLDAEFFRVSSTPGQGDCLEFCISDPEQNTIRILDRIRLPLPAGMSASAVAEVLKLLHFEGALILFRLDLAGQKACYDPGENRWLSYRGPASLPNPDDERHPYPSDEAGN